jgi:hypothetical protein
LKLSSNQDLFADISNQKNENQNNGEFYDNSSINKSDMEINDSNEGKDKTENEIDEVYEGENKDEKNENEKIENENDESNGVEGTQENLLKNLQESLGDRMKQLAAMHASAIEDQPNSKVDICMYMYVCVHMY